MDEKPNPYAAPTSPLPGPEEAPPSPWDERRPPAPRWRLPAVLYAVTCLSTYLVGGPVYMLGVMLILTAHELGHFFQARRYGIPASFPFFLPMPLTPIGTLGAVIAMRPQSANRKALFDLAITGPVAGLVPAIVLSYVGLKMSRLTTLEESEDLLTLGEPLVFKLLSYLAVGPLPEGQDVVLHPLAYAGWVGIFITALNLLPIGQLDGGHILYALMPNRAYAVSLVVMAGAVVAVVAGGLWHWTLMLLLLLMIVRHPPAAHEDVPIDGKRVFLGWLMLLFLPFGFTPTPFVF